MILPTFRFFWNYVINYVTWQSRIIHKKSGSSIKYKNVHFWGVFGHFFKFKIFQIFLYCKCRQQGSIWSICKQPHVKIIFLSVGCMPEFENAFFLDITIFLSKATLLNNIRTIFEAIYEKLKKCPRVLWFPVLLYRCKQINMRQSHYLRNGRSYEDDLSLIMTGMSTFLLHFQILKLLESNIKPEIANFCKELAENG